MTYIFDKKNSQKILRNFKLTNFKLTFEGGIDNNVSEYEGETVPPFDRKHKNKLVLFSCDVIKRDEIW